MPSRALTALLGLAAALSLVAVPAQAADTSGPTLSVPPRGSFIVGQQIADPQDIAELGGLSFANGGALKQYKWTASDPSGICASSVDNEMIYGWEEGTRNPSNATSGTYTFGADYWGTRSGDVFAFRVNVWDCAGNKRSIERGLDTYLTVAKDYGPTVPSGWKRTTWVGAVGDSMLNTSTYKASLSTVVAADGHNGHVALVMAKGPGRGKASIYFDGVYVKTIDTYAPANINRVVMWDKELGGTRNHTIKVVNQATSGHPRIDIDAYIR
jgi:hypothetical protein